MIDHPRPSEHVTLRLDPGQPLHHLWIEAEGPGLALFAANAPPQADPDEVTPDPLDWLAGMIADGWFGPPPALTLHQTQFDPTGPRQLWQVTAQNLAPGLWRILANLLVARGLTRLSLRSARISPRSEGAASDCDLSALPYPLPPRATLFTLDHQTPDLAERERWLELELAAPPDEASLARLYAIMDRWVRLLALGAYPRPRHSPCDAGILPDLAVLTAPNLLFQGIEIAFACDEAAFVPLITCFHTGEGRDLGVTRMTIR